MNCPNCGRELAEGELCNCIENEAFPNAQPINKPNFAENEMPQGEPAQNPYAPPVYYPPQGAYYAPDPSTLQARCDYPQGYKIKRKYVAVLLGFFLGVFGIHNFYLGNSSKAIAQVLLTTVGSLFFFLGPVAASIWALVETVQLLTETIDRDANGFKIQTFEEALVKAQKDSEN